MDSPDKILKDKVVKNHLDAKTMIEQSMDEELRCRNDDMWLCLRVWLKQGIRITVEPEDIPNMINPETIIRNRAFIQNKENKLLPTDVNVIIRRKIKEDALKEFYGGTRDELITEFQQRKFGVK